MNSSSTRTQQIIRHSLTLAMTACFIAAGWLLLKPLVRPASAEASTSASAPWTTKAIEDIQVGDLVLARDEQGTALGWKPVKEVYRRTSYHLRHLTFRDAAGREQTFETTDEHPFWSVTAQAFVNARELETGDQVVSVPSHAPSGKTPVAVDPALIQTLTATHRDEHPAGITVHNFQVEDFHTYFVAARGATGPPVLVHNADFPEIPDPRVRPDYDPGATHRDHVIARSLDGLDDPSNLRDIPGGMNFRKGGLEGELAEYERGLIAQGMSPVDARSVIQDEIDALGRDVIASPFTSVFGPGGLPLE